MAEVILLNISAVRARVGVSRTTIYKMLAKGTFPKPAYPAPHMPRWRSDEIEAYIERLSAARAA